MGRIKVFATFGKSFFVDVEADTLDFLPKSTAASKPT
jgi:CRISPR-associated Cas5-like protein